MNTILSEHSADDAARSNSNKSNFSVIGKLDGETYSHGIPSRAEAIQIASEYASEYGAEFVVKEVLS